MILRIMIMYVRITSQEVTRSDVFLQAFHTSYGIVLAKSMKSQRQRECFQ